MNENDNLNVTIQRLLHTASMIDRITAADTIITTYDLPFNANDMIKAVDILNRIELCAFALMLISLTNNLALFIAIIHAQLDGYDNTNWTMYLTFNIEKTHSNILGCVWSSLKAIKTWSDLYDYHEFDISELDLSKGLRKALQKHIDSKVTYTKRAVK